jgi:hypothetical protein
VTDIDYRALEPKIKHVLSRSSKLRVCGDFSEFEGWEWAHSMDKFPFAGEDVHKVAIIGDALGKELAELAQIKLVHSEVRFFDQVEKKAALDWVRKN